MASSLTSILFSSLLAKMCTLLEFKAAQTEKLTLKARRVKCKAAFFSPERVVCHFNGVLMTDTQQVKVAESNHGPVPTVSSDSRAPEKSSSKKPADSYGGACLEAPDVPRVLLFETELVPGSIPIWKFWDIIRWSQRKWAKLTVRPFTFPTPLTKTNKNTQKNTSFRLGVTLVGPNSRITKLCCWLKWWWIIYRLRNNCPVTNHVFLNVPDIIFQSAGQGKT